MDKIVRVLKPHHPETLKNENNMLKKSKSLNSPIKLYSMLIVLLILSSTIYSGTAKIWIFGDSQKIVNERPDDYKRLMENIPDDAKAKGA